MATDEFLQEYRDYAHLHSTILEDADVRSLSDSAFRLWVTALTYGATVSRNEVIRLGTAKKVSAWSGVDAGQVPDAVNELLDAKFFLDVEGDDPDGFAMPARVRVRNLVRYQTTPAQSAQTTSGDDDDSPATIEELCRKLRRLLEADAVANGNLPDYDGFLETVIPAALETYAGMPGLGDGDPLFDEVLFHASSTYCQQPGGEIAMRSWRAALRQLRAWYGPERVLFGLREAAFNGKQSLPYVRAVVQGRGR